MVVETEEAKKRALYKAWYEAHRDGRTIKSREWRERNAKYLKRWRKVFYRKNKEKIRQYQKERNFEIKQEILSYYGNGKLACVTCGETRIACLSIDHINGHGGEHRKSLGLAGKAFYPWLKKQGFPLGYQTLCMNCQWVKRFNGDTKGIEVK